MLDVNEIHYLIYLTRSSRIFHCLLSRFTISAQASTTSLASSFLINSSKFSTSLGLAIQLQCSPGASPDHPVEECQYSSTHTSKKILGHIRYKCRIVVKSTLCLSRRMERWEMSSWSSSWQPDFYTCFPLKFFLFSRSISKEYLPSTFKENLFYNACTCAGRPNLGAFFMHKPSNTKILSNYQAGP